MLAGLLCHWPVWLFSLSLQTGLRPKLFSDQIKRMNQVLRGKKYSNNMQCIKNSSSRMCLAIKWQESSETACFCRRKSVFQEFQKLLLNLQRWKLYAKIANNGAKEENLWEVDERRGLRTLNRLLEMDQIYERTAKKLAKLIWNTRWRNSSKGGASQANWGIHSGSECGTNPYNDISLIRTSQIPSLNPVI